jgi:hypothetical protein
MYNLIAFDLCGCQQYPLYSVTCLHYPASSGAYLNKRNTATSWKQEQ